MYKTSFESEFSIKPSGQKSAPLIKSVTPTTQKVSKTIEKAIVNSGLKSGMTISFHHHFRSGDYILNDVMDIIADMGFKNMKLASSSLAAIHTPLIKHIESGVISEIHTSGLRGLLATEISGGLMEKTRDYQVTWRPCESDRSR